jgi:hypothetical protein
MASEGQVSRLEDRERATNQKGALWLPLYAAQEMENEYERQDED